MSILNSYNLSPSYLSDKLSQEQMYKDVSVPLFAAGKKKSLKTTSMSIVGGPG